MFGGKSAEHAVSIQSGRNVMQGLNPEKYEIMPIGIDENGEWHYLPEPKNLFVATAPGLAELKSGDSVALQVDPGTGALVSASGMPPKIDVVFPVLHGPMGEDGTVQGFLKLANLPYVGCGVLASAVAMDKDICKRILRDAGLNVAPFRTVTRTQQAALDLEEIVDSLGLPLFVKPANMGSSVGVSKVNSLEELGEAIIEAFRFDTKILIESGIVGRELEVAVLGNEHPEASVPGEVVNTNSEGFYSFAAKYVSEDGAKIVIPAALNEAEVATLQHTAKLAFEAITGEGMARVDMFLTETGEVVINEINTIPGFTNISMYPKLWEATGVAYSDLLDRLINLAVERHTRDADLATRP